MKNKNIVIIGDTIKDIFVDLEQMGESVEEVPTYHETCKREYSGGAANVAKHCLQLGASVLLIHNTHPSNFRFTEDDNCQFHASSFGGRDLSKQRLLHDYINVHEVKKYRFLLNGKKHHKINVFDEETQGYLFGRTTDFSFLSEWCDKFKFAPDVVIAADNRHGMFSDGSACSLVETCQKMGVKLLVDSQASQNDADITVWQGATSLFVNATERIKYNTHAMTENIFETIHVKCGSDGSYIERRVQNGAVLPMEGRGFKVDVIDPLGAGDAYLAAWAVYENLRLSNAWAALSCTKQGTELPFIDELETIDETSFRLCES